MVCPKCQRDDCCSLALRRNILAADENKAKEIEQLKRRLEETRESLHEKTRWLMQEQEACEHWRSSALGLGNGAGLVDKLAKVKALAEEASLHRNPMVYVVAVADILKVLEG